MRLGTSVPLLFPVFFCSLWKVAVLAIISQSMAMSGMDLVRTAVWGVATIISDVIFVRLVFGDSYGSTTDGIIHAFLAFASLFTFRICTLLATYFDENGVRAEWSIVRTLRAVEAEATAILHNLLPAHAVSTIMLGFPVTPRVCRHATVLVLDLVNFTSFASNLSSRECMELLNIIYSKFDELVDASGLWKVRLNGWRVVHDVRGG
jgi:hypothetical protein